MPYDIIKAAAPAAPRQGVKTEERRTMELLEVGDAFIVTTEEAYHSARWARPSLYPKRFTVRRITVTSWQVRRTA